MSNKTVFIISANELDDDNYEYNVYKDNQFKNEKNLNFYENWKRILKTVYNITLQVLFFPKQFLGSNSLQSDLLTDSLSKDNPDEFPLQEILTIFHRSL